MNTSTTRLSARVSETGCGPPTPWYSISASFVDLRALEIGQDVLVAPAVRAARRPCVIVVRVAPDVDHRVHRARPAQHPAPGQVGPTAAKLRFRLAVVIPIPAGLE